MPLPISIEYFNGSYSGDLLIPVLSGLRSIGGAHERFANRIDEDVTEFQLAVKRDLDAIQRGLTDDRGEPFGRGTLLVFTNEQAREGKAWFGIRGKELRSVDFHFPAPRHRCEQVYPLARPETFEAALSLAQTLAPKAPATLVLKSHGSQELALTTLAGELLDVRDDELRGVLEELDLKEFAGRNDKKLGRYFLGFHHLGRVHLGGAYSAGYGTSKHTLVQMLRNAHAQSPLELVAVEACDAALDSLSLQALPQGLATYTLKNPTSYNNIDYTSAFERMRSGTPLSEALSGVLAAGGFERQIGLSS